MCFLIWIFLCELSRQIDISSWYSWFSGLCGVCVLGHRVWQGGKTCEGNFQQASKFFRQMALMSSCASAAVVFTLEKHVNANISYECMNPVANQIWWNCPLWFVWWSLISTIHGSELQYVLQIACEIVFWWVGNKFIFYADPLTDT